MTRSKILLAAAAATLGWLSAAPAEAQYYGSPYGYYGQPTYVPPRIARKQRQLEERFVEKYGYVSPGRAYRRSPYGYNPGYGGPGYGGQAYGRQGGYYRRQPNGYDQYGSPMPFNPKLQTQTVNPYSNK